MKEMERGQSGPAAPSAGAARRMRGIRAAWIWGCVLLFLSLVYGVLYLALDARRERAWKRSMEEVLRTQDPDAVAALLAACRKEQPDLVKSPYFALCESRWIELEKMRKERAERLNARLNDLQKALDDDAWRKRDIPRELGETARLAASEQELEAITQLKMQYETLLRAERMSEAQKIAAELESLKTSLRKLPELRKGHQYEGFAVQYKALSDQLAALKLQAEDHVEIRSALTRMQEELEAEARQNELEKKAWSSEEAAYRNLLAAGVFDDVKLRAEAFLRQYPGSGHAEQLRQFLNRLSMMQYPYAGKLQSAWQTLHDQAADVQHDFLADWNELAKKVLIPVQYELELTETSGKKVLVFIPDPAWPDGTAISMAGTDPAQSVRIFREADGKVKLVADSGQDTVLCMASPAEEKLPEAAYQKKFMNLNGSWRDPDGFLRAIDDLDCSVAGPYQAELNALKQKALAKLSEKTGQDSRAGAYCQLQMEVYEEALAHLPQFAGILEPTAAGTRFYASGGVFGNSDCWIAERSGEAWRFVRIGRLGGDRELMVEDSLAIKPGQLYAVWSAFGNWDAAARRSEWEAKAAAQQLPSLNFPDYWVKK